MENSTKVKSFLDAIEDVCKEYNMSISHADDGFFIIENFHQQNIDELRNADTSIFATDMANLPAPSLEPECTKNKKVRVYVHIEDGVIQNVYSNNQNCQVIIGEIDDNANDGEQVILHDYNEPEVQYPFSSEVGLLFDDPHTKFRNKLVSGLRKDLAEIENK